MTDTTNEWSVDVFSIHHQEQGAIIRYGDRKGAPFLVSGLSFAVSMIWDNFSTNCAILMSYIRADPRTCRGSVLVAWMSSRYVIKWQWCQLRDSLTDFSQLWQEIKQERRTRALLRTFAFMRPRLWLVEEQDILFSATLYYH